MDDTTVRVVVADATSERVAAAARENAPGGVRVRATGPVGWPAASPLVLVTRGGRTAFHPNTSQQAVRSLVDADALSADRAAFVVDHDPDVTTLPVPDDGPLAVGRRRALGRCGWVTPEAEPTERVADDPETVEARVRETGLRGRGRGDVASDDSVAAAWDATRDAATDGDDPVVVVNGNEADERVAGDELLLASDPVGVLDAAVAVARVVGATDVVVSANERHGRAVEAAKRAVEAHPWGAVTPEVVVAPDDYLAAEPTMALESLEGSDRLEARLRPPYPTEHGLYGRPTVIHTPRTLAQVRAVARDPSWVDADAADPGTRLVTLSGDVAARATVELPTAGSLDAVRAVADPDDGFGFACVGGRFGGLTASLDVPPSAPALDRAGLGTEGAVEWFGASRCPVAVAGTRARVAAEENCGRCVPCREGSVQLTDLLREVYDGDVRDGAIRELARTMRATSTCDFGRMAVRPALSALSEFETQFDAHAAGRCPAGACGEGA